jgi:signal transduction histidine kinase
LAIAQRIAEAHDGSLTLEPLPTGGLRATVRLVAAR